MERKEETEHRIWRYIHCHPNNLPSLIRESQMDYQMMLSELLLLAELFHVLDEPFLEKVNTIYPYITDATYLHHETEQHILSLILGFKDKIEMTCKGI